MYDQESNFFKINLVIIFFLLVSNLGNTASENVGDDWCCNGHCGFSIDVSTGLDFFGEDFNLNIERDVLGDDFLEPTL